MARMPRIVVPDVPPPRNRAWKSLKADVFHSRWLRSLFRIHCAICSAIRSGRLGLLFDAKSRVFHLGSKWGRWIESNFCRITQIVQASNQFQERLARAFCGKKDSIRFRMMSNIYIKQCATLNLIRLRLYSSVVDRMRVIVVGSTIVSIWLYKEYCLFLFYSALKTCFWYYITVV